VSTTKSAAYPLSQEAQEATEQEIHQLLIKRAIEEVDPLSLGHRSPLFTVPKKNGQLRPILNLRKVNSFIPHRHFKMESLLQVCRIIRSKDWMTSIDLTDAFLHVLINKASRRFLQFDWAGRRYQFRVLPFGLSLSPLVFTKILRPVLRWARSKGIRISAYLDDLIIIASSKSLAKEHTSLVTKMLERLGFLINNAKSALRPTQILKHLGFYINTRKMILTLPKDKVRELKREATALWKSTTTTIRRLASFIGKAQAAMLAVLPARLQTRHLVACKDRALASGLDWSSSIQLSKEALSDIDWWRNHLQSWTGQSFLPQIPEVDLFTDASDWGWGIVLPNKVISRPWSSQDAQQSINWRELKTVLHAVHLPEVQGKVIQIHSDSSTALAYVTKFGGTRSTLLMDLARQIWTHCLQTGTRVMTSFIKSEDNPADLPSRALWLQTEWTLDPTLFQMIDKMWGPHTVDLFASRNNSQLPRFISWKPDPQALATNALTVPWTQENGFASPPWALISQCLAKVQREQSTLTLVTPYWPSAIWFPTLRNLTLYPPLLIQPQDRLALSPDGTQLDWTLAAWRISGSGSRRKAHQRPQ
jgi:hypothetical protein